MKIHSLSLWQSALIAGAVSILLNLFLLQLVKPLAPDFMSLSTWPIVFWTTVATIGATVVFALIRHIVQDPIPLFIKVSIAALILSFGMDIPLFFFDIPFFAGATTGGILSLMSMHVVAAGVIVPTLIKLTVWSR